jgi:(p)ppGpp synthase/HD superfamily hydrolase
MFSAMFKKAKSQDFPVECRAMYYFAKGRHAHQERKGSGMPYFVHPRGVAWLVKKYGGTISQINAAFGHDLLEDTETSFEEIAVISGSEETAELVLELTNNRHIIEEMGKTEYMTEKLLKLSKDALLIKLADMVYNSYDQPAEKAKNRMYYNVCQLLLKRKDIPQNCRELAQLVILAD